MDVETFLALDTTAQVITVEKSSFSHSGSVLGLSEAQLVIKGEVLGHYYASIVYADLSKEQYNTKIYW